MLQPSLAVFLLALGTSGCIVEDVPIETGEDKIEAAEVIGTPDEFGEVDDPNPGDDYDEVVDDHGEAAADVRDQLASRVEELEEARRGNDDEDDEQPDVEEVAVPVYFHVIKKRDRSGGVNESRLEKLITYLDEAFAGETRKKKRKRAQGDTGFRFGPEYEVIETVDRELFKKCRKNYSEFLESNRVGGPEALNIVVCPIKKQAYKAIAMSPYNDPLGGVVIGSSLVKRNLKAAKRILVHEVGHWLGLYDTYKNGCSEPGDEIDDTPAQKKPKKRRLAGGDVCRRTNTCPGKRGKDPSENFMNSTSIKCRHNFTEGQITRMIAVWDQYRSPVVDPNTIAPDIRGRVALAPNETPRVKITKVKRSQVTGKANDPDLDGPVNVVVLVDGEYAGEGLADMPYRWRGGGHQHRESFGKFKINVPRMSKGRHTVSVVVPDYGPDGQILDEEGATASKRARFTRR